jgi:hypothetical protein
MGTDDSHGYPHRLFSTSSSGAVAVSCGLVASPATVYAAVFVSSRHRWRRSATRIVSLFQPSFEGTSNRLLLFPARPPCPAGSFFGHDMLSFVPAALSSWWQWLSAQMTAE